MMDLFGFLILFGLLSYPVGLIKPRWLGGSRKRALAISSGWVVAAFIGFAVVAPKKAPEPTAEVPAAPAFTAATTATASRQDELRPLRLPLLKGALSGASSRRFFRGSWKSRC